MKRNNSKEFEKQRSESLQSEQQRKQNSKKKHLDDIKVQSIDNSKHSQNNSSNLNALSKKQDIIEESDEDDSSDDEAERQEVQKLKQNIKKQNLKVKANQKMVVGSGFSMDVTDFFQFQKKKQLSSEGEGLFQEYGGGRLAWILLLFSVSNGAVVPGWIMTIKATKILRKSWRFFMQALMVIPFVLYERRTANEETKKKYSLSYILDPQNLKKPFISSFATSFWFTVILTCFEWTSISHAICLGSLSNFFLSIGRYMRNSSHDLESGGQILVICGILLAIEDSFSFTAADVSIDDYDVINSIYYGRKWYQRCLADLAALSASYVMSQFSKYTSDMKTYYPPFLSMFIVHIFNTINLALSSYFFNGATFDFDSFWGIFSLFTQQHFSGFMYMAIILSLGQLISLVLISRMFPDPIIPALAITLQPMIASLIVQITGVQNLPGGFTLLGYVLIVPGLILILTGQCMFQRIKSKLEIQQKKMKEMLEEMQELNRLTVVQEEKEKKKKKKKKNQKQMAQLKIIVTELIKNQQNN